jgi:hypothetical protein
VPARAWIPGHPASVLFGSDSSHGNGKLLVGGVGEGGVIRADESLVARDGSIRWKLGSWGKGHGMLEILGSTPATGTYATAERTRGR